MSGVTRSPEGTPTATMRSKNSRASHPSQDRGRSVRRPVVNDVGRVRPPLGLGRVGRRAITARACAAWRREPSDAVRREGTLRLRAELEPGKESAFRPDPPEPVKGPRQHDGVSRTTTHCRGGTAPAAGALPFPLAAPGSLGPPGDHRDLAAPLEDRFARCPPRARRPAAPGPPPGCPPCRRAPAPCRSLRPPSRKRTRGTPSISASRRGDRRLISDSPMSTRIRVITMSAAFVRE